MTSSWRSSPLPPGWPRTRARILARDGHACTNPGCQAPATHVDHVTPAHLGGPDTDTNLQSLCRACHAAKTSREANAAGGPGRPGRWQSPRRPAEPHPGLS